MRVCYKDSIRILSPKKRREWRHCEQALRSEELALANINPA